MKLRQNEQVQKLLTAYRSDSETVQEIANRFGISIACVTCWAKRKGLQLRGRGCRPRKEPTRLQQEILRLTLFQTQSEVAKRFGLARTRVHFLRNRWRSWMLTRFAQDRLGAVGRGNAAKLSKDEARGGKSNQIRTVLA